MKVESYLPDQNIYTSNLAKSTVQQMLIMP